MLFIPTSNLGVDPVADADSIKLDGFSTANPIFYNVFEGATATADIFGRIVGDPQLQFIEIRLAPGQEGNGFLSQGISGVPDSGATLMLFGGALAVLLVARRKLLA
jgi:hypothetical protein